MIDITNEIAAIQVATTGSAIRSALIEALSALNGEVPTWYSGAYIINPSIAEIILSTSGKTLASDLTIRPYLAPSVYSGSYSIDPAATSKVLSVSGYLMSQDVVVNAFSGASLISKAINDNGVYSASSDNADGYSEVIVSVYDKSRPLPSDYQEVAYIETVDYQYIAFPYAEEIGDMIFIKAAPLGSSSVGFFGKANFLGYEFWSGTGRIWFQSEKCTYDIIDVYSSEYSIGSSYNFAARLTEIIASVSSNWLLGMYRSDRYPFDGRIYSACIVRYSNLSMVKILDFIPCYRKLDSVVGFYDMAHSSFYLNSGSGAFIAGPSVN